MLEECCVTNEMQLKQDEIITKKKQQQVETSVEDFNVIPMQLDYDYENNTKR